jgi:Arc/MetJ-type ribon-helix-helix transcriptional regulator
MATPTRRATVSFDPKLHNALKLKAIAPYRSISEIVNTAVKEALAEDAEDISAIKERGDEPLISFSEMIKRLKEDDRT